MWRQKWTVSYARLGEEFGLRVRIRKITVSHWISKTKSSTLNGWGRDDTVKLTDLPLFFMFTLFISFRSAKLHDWVVFHISQILRGISCAYLQCSGLSARFWSLWSRHSQSCHTLTDRRPRLLKHHWVQVSVASPRYTCCGSESQAHANSRGRLKLQISRSASRMQVSSCSLSSSRLVGFSFPTQVECRRRRRLGFKCNNWHFIFQQSHLDGLYSLKKQMSGPTFGQYPDSSTQLESQVIQGRRERHFCRSHGRTRIQAGLCCILADSLLSWGRLEFGKESSPLCSKAEVGMSIHSEIVGKFEGCYGTYTLLDDDVTSHCPNGQREESPSGTVQSLVDIRTHPTLAPCLCNSARIVLIGGSFPLLFWAWWDLQVSDSWLCVVQGSTWIRMATQFFRSFDWAASEVVVGSKWREEMLTLEAQAELGLVLASRICYHPDCLKGSYYSEFVPRVQSSWSSLRLDVHGTLEFSIDQVGAFSWRLRWGPCRERSRWSFSLVDPGLSTRNHFSTVSLSSHTDPSLIDGEVDCLRFGRDGLSQVRLSMMIDCGSSVTINSDLNFAVICLLSADRGFLLFSECFHLANLG